MAEYRLKVTADTRESEAKVRELGKAVDAATKERKLEFDTSSLTRSLEHIKQYQRDSKGRFISPGSDVLRQHQQLATEAKGVALSAQSATTALNRNAEAAQQLAKAYSTAGGGAMRLVENFSKIGLALFGVQQAVGLARGAFQGFFNETIGREIQLRETILKTQTTLASTNKVFRNGSEITDPYQKIVALTGAVDERVNSIRKRSIELAGVTSNEVIEVFGLVSSQIGSIGGGLKEAEDLAISFAAALGTFGIPLQQARQEIGSIMRGDITQDSYLAQALQIKPEDIQKAKTQAGGVVAFIQKKLEASVAGQKISAQSFSGVMDNLRDLRELAGQEFGKGLLDPMLGGLRSIFNYLNSIRDTLFSITREAGKGIGDLLSNNLTAIIGGSDLFSGMGASAAEGAKQFVTTIQKAFASLQSDANAFIAPVRNILEELVKSAGVLLSAFLELGKALGSIGIESLKSMASLLSNLSEVVTVVATGLAGVLKVLTALVQLPPVTMLAQLAAQVAILNKLGITQLFANAIGPLRNMSTAVVGLGQNLLKSGVSLRTFSAAAAGMSAAVSAAVVSMGRAVASFMRANAYMLAIQVTLTVVMDLFGRFQRQQEELARTQKAEAALKELNTTYRDLGDSATEAQKRQKAYLESLVSNEYDAAISKLDEWDEKLRQQAGPNIFEKLGNSVKWFAGELDKLLRKFGPLLSMLSGGALGGAMLGASAGKQLGKGSKSTDNKIFGFDTRLITDPMGRHSKTGWYQQELLRGQKEAQANEKKFRLPTKAEGGSADDIRMEAQQQAEANLEKQKQFESDMAERRRAFEEELAGFRKSQEDAVFERRQSLAQKEIDIFRAAGELRIAQMEQANAKLLEGEEGASRAAMEALNTYITEREKGVLDTEAQKKELTSELVKMEKTLADYRLEQEKRIAEIRRKADEYTMRAAQGQQELAAGMSGSATTGGATGLSGGTAFDSGLRTGPAHVIGGSSEYHQDMAFGAGVPLKEQVALVRQMAQEYEKVGRAMVLSNKAVHGRVFPTNGSEAEQTKWVVDARAAHRSRDGGRGRDAIDFYTPSKRVADASGGKAALAHSSAVESTPMLAPVIPGAQREYFSGGRNGAGMRLTRGGQQLFSLIHGRTDRALPQNGAIPGASMATGRAASTPRASTSGITPELRAALDTIRHAEGTWLGGSDKGYRTMFGGGTFNSFARHPDKVIRSDRYASAAAGAYQFMPDTWNEVSKKRGLKDFSPESQDLAAIEQLKKRGVYDALKAGKFTPEIAAKMAPEWASFPTMAGGSYYGQPNKKFSELQKFYQSRVGANREVAPAQTLPEYGSIESPEHMRKIEGLDRQLIGSQERLQQLTASIKDLGNTKNFEAIGKAFEQALPGKQDMEAIESEIFSTMQTIAAMGEATGQALDPELSKITVENATNRMVLEREIGQMQATFAQDSRLTDQEKTKAQEMLNQIADKYLNTQEKVLALKKQQLGVERAKASIEEMQQKSQQARQAAADNRKRAGMIRSGMSDSQINYQLEIDAINKQYEDNLKLLRASNPVAGDIDFSAPVDTGMFTAAVAKSSVPSVLPANNIVPTTGKPAAAAPPNANPISAITGGITTDLSKAESALLSFSAAASTTLGPALEAALSPQGMPTLMENLSKVTSSITDPTGGIAAATKSRDDLLSSKQDEFNSQQLLNSPVLQLVGQWREEIGATEQMVASLGSTIQSELSGAMSTSLIGLVNGTNTAKEAFASMFQSIGKTMVDTATQMLSKSLMTGLLGGGDPGGGLLGSIFGLGGGGGGGGLGSLLGGLFGGRAVGGNVDRGRAYPVGERGPEIFVPDTGGQIIPNHRTQAYAAMSRPVDSSAFPKTMKGGTDLRQADPFAENKNMLNSIAAASQKRNADKSLASIGGTAEIKYSRVSQGDLPFITEEDALQIAKQAEMNGAKMGQQRTLAALRNNPSTRRGIGI